MRLTVLGNDGQVQLVIMETHGKSTHCPEETNRWRETAARHWWCGVSRHASPFLSLTHVSVWAHFTQTAWMPAMITASHVCGPCGFDFHTPFIYPHYITSLFLVSLHLHSSPPQPSSLWWGIISGPTEFFISFGWLTAKVIPSLHLHIMPFILHTYH